MTGTVADAARLWTIRVGDPAFADWDGFTEWLEADPRHASAYDAAVASEAHWTERFAAAPLPARKDVVPPRRPWLGMGAAAAALIAVVAGVVTLNAPKGIEEEIATRAGERRTVALADGSELALNGATRVRFDRQAPRRVTLIEGQALFRVRHDAADPFIVTAGDAKLMDAGTVFDVVRQAAETRVAVGEGAVVYRPDADALMLRPGDALTVQDGGKPVLRHIPALDVGAWRAGKLIYQDAPIERVARDLGRNLGTIVRPEGMGGRRFTGVLNIAGDPADALERVAPLLGARALRRDDAWILAPDDALPR